jgi:hypothetical protein
MGERNLHVVQLSDESQGRWLDSPYRGASDNDEEKGNNCWLIRRLLVSWLAFR